MKLWQKLFPDHRPARPLCSMIIPAAGRSRRMGGGENKLLLPLAGKPVLVHTLQAVDAARGVSEIVIAAREEELIEFAGLCKEWGIQKPVKIVAGGETRGESVFRAACETDPNADLIAVHDAARPLATPELIDSVIEAARIHFAAAPAIPVKDTVKFAVDGVVRNTPDRPLLFAVQTPQAFDAQIFRAALKAAKDAGFVMTDDCSAVERLGKEVCLTDGSEENIKITTPLDMVIAQSIFEKREG